jgi:formate dehydrogenase subunit delta
MDTDNLVRMANRIGQFFEAMPDRNEALDGIATHLQKFWEPRMRRAFLTHLDAGGEGVMAIVAEAVQAHRARLA